MAWAPTIAAVDVRSIVGNLVGYMRTNQEAALAWSSPSRPLTSLTLYETAEVRMKKDFPHAGVVRRRTRVDDEETSKVVTYELTLEYEVEAEHPSDDAARTTALAQLAVDVDAVGYAFESMVLNIPTATLYGSGVHEIFRTVTGSDPLEVAVSPAKSMFNVQQQVVLQFRRTLYN